MKLVTKAIDEDIAGLEGNSWLAQPRTQGEMQA